MSKLKTWFLKNKVLLFGLIAAIAMDAQQLFSNNSIDWKVVGLSVGVVVTSYLSKNLRGQWVTILGSLGVSMTTVLTAYESHQPISWSQVIASLVVSIFAANSPAGKSISYEKTSVIEGAKMQAKAMDGAKRPPVSPPVQTIPPNVP